MLPPSLPLAVPRALALASPHIPLAVTAIVIPTAHKLALQLSNRHSTLQAERARRFHWWCRRSPRRYSSWNSRSPPNPIDGTEQRVEEGNKSAASKEEFQRDGYELSTREKMWKIRRDMIERLMRRDPYDMIFGPSNRMLKGLNWRSGPHAVEFKKLWEQQWKEMDKMHVSMQQRMEQAFGGKTPEEKRFLDQFLGGGKGQQEAKLNNSGKDKSIKQDWTYDAISNRMIQKEATEPTSWPKVVETPIKAFEPKVEINWGNEVMQPAQQTVEASGHSLTVAESSHTTATANEANRQAGKPQLPLNDSDLLTAHDIRARMGRIKAPPKESSEQRAEQRTQLEERFDGLQQTQDEPIARPAWKYATTTDHSHVRVQPNEDENLSRLQREQLKEAAKDFQVREKRSKTAIRELEELHDVILADLSDLRGRCEELAKLGTLTLMPKDFATIQATLAADTKVLDEASTLVAKAVAVSPKSSTPSTPQHMEPSLDRYAWSKKPFAKIRDAEQLVQNVKESLANVQETVDKFKTVVERKANLASKLNDEIETNRRAMRGIEEKWHKRNDAPNPSTAAVDECGNTDTDLVREIRNIYEDRYGTITTKHRQVSYDSNDPALSALEEQVNIGKNDTGNTSTRLDNEISALSLGAIPDLPPASLDGGPEPEVTGSPDSLASMTLADSTVPPAQMLNSTSEIILELDPKTLTSRATTVNISSISGHKAISISDTLQRLARPEKFIDQLVELNGLGFEPVIAKPSVVLLRRKPRTPSNASILSTSPKTQTLSSTPRPIATANSSVAEPEPSEPPSQEPDSSGPFYSTKLQSPTTSTFQGLRPKRVEPVFSGSQGGHQQYENLRRHLRHQVRERRDRKRRRRGGFRKVIMGAGLLGAGCYAAGVISESQRRREDRLER